MPTVRDHDPGGTELVAADDSRAIDVRSFTSAPSCQY
jgi:hypothetical protein